MTLHPGLDARWWGAAAAARAEPGDGPLRVLFVGNDVERKGLDRSLPASALTARSSSSRQRRRGRSERPRAGPP